MVQITTVHDMELNQKVFRIRGDEGYAKTTSITIVDADEYTYHVTDYNMQITATLKRGTGNSYVAIIDNGVTIDVKEWQSVNTTQTFVITNLTYDVEHNISVKYLGNTQCLKSTSNTLQIQKENTSSKTTEIILSPNNTYVDYDKTGTISLQLKNTSDSTEEHPYLLYGVPVKLYINGVLRQTKNIPSTSPYIVTFNLSDIHADIPYGLKHMKIVFEGYSTGSVLYSASSVEFDYSLGMNITIGEHPEVFLNGAQSVFDTNLFVTAEDYFENPISNATLYLSNSDNLVYGDTDQDGLAILFPTNIVNNGEYYVFNGASKSKSQIFKSATVTGVELTPTTTILIPNSSAIINAKVTGTDIQRGIGVRLYNAGRGYTDENGEINITPRGTGAGDHEIHVFCGGIENSIIMEDLLFYYNANALNYAPYTMFSQIVTKQPNGLKFNVQAGEGTLVCGLGDVDNQIGDFELTFDVVNQSFTEVSSESDVGYKGLTMFIGSWNSNGYTQPTEFTRGASTGMDTGAKFKIVKVGSDIIVYRKRVIDSNFSECTWANSTDTSRDNPCIFLNPWYVKDINLVLNNIKLKKVRGSQ